MINTLFAFILLLLLSLPAVALPADEDYEGRLTEVKGEVTVFTAEDPEGGPGLVDMPLAAGDRVKTGADSSAEITFSGEHSLSLRARSEFALTSVRRADCEFQLLLGSLLAKVQALAGGSLRVRTPAAVAAVRGTEFGVEVSAEDPGETHVGVFDEGQVEVKGETGGAELLHVNQETQVRRGQRPLAAYQLKRFMRQRQLMRSFRKRAQQLRKQWRALPPAERLHKRRQLVERGRELRREKVEKLRQLRERSPKRELKPRQDQLKMQDRKRAIRERIRGRRE